MFIVQCVSAENVASAQLSVYRLLSQLWPPTLNTAFGHLTTESVTRRRFWSMDARMVRYNTEQRVFLVETYIAKKKSYRKCIRKFRKAISGLFHTNKAECYKIIQ